MQNNNSVLINLNWNLIETRFHFSFDFSHIDGFFGTHRKTKKYIFFQRSNSLFRICSCKSPSLRIRSFAKFRFAKDPIFRYFLANFRTATNPDSISFNANVSYFWTSWLYSTPFSFSAHAVCQRDEFFHVRISVCRWWNICKNIYAY